MLAATGVLMDRHGGPVWDEESFLRLRAAVAADVTAESTAVLETVLRVLQEWRETDRALSGSVDLLLLPAMSDMRAQVGRLVRRGFVADTGAEQLQHLPRYLRAVRTRVDRLASGVGRDRQLMEAFRPLEEAYLNRVSALAEGHPEPRALREVRWLLEEYRVSLWAQQLGTPRPVSDNRIRKALDAA